MSKLRAWALACSIAITAAFGFLLASRAAAESALPASRSPQESNDFSPLAATLAISTNCRYGVSGTPPYFEWIAAQDLGIGWHLDFGYDASVSRLPGSEYVNIIRVLQDKDAHGNYLNTYSVYPALTEDGLGAALAADQGALWLVGNEPDRGPDKPGDANRVQDDTQPGMYARIYHDVYQYIKQRDRTAQVANAGLVQVSPNRLQYLDRVWAAYQQAYGSPMPVDVWNMHIYILPEATHDGNRPDEVASIAVGTDLSLAQKESTLIPGDTQWCGRAGYTCLADVDNLKIFGVQVTAMRAWMQRHGQRNKPLILSEFGQLYPCLNCDNPTNPSRCDLRDEFGKCFSLARTAAFLTNSFAYLSSAADPAIGYPLDGNHLVQQWLWFSLNFRGFPISNLISDNKPFTYTAPGLAFRAAVATIPTAVNLMATSARLSPFLVEDSMLHITVEAGVVNNGTTTPSAPVNVTIYEDAALAHPIANGTLTSVPGCARREPFAVISWTVPAATPGVLSYYVVVNPHNSANETTLGDNLLAIQVIPNPSANLLP